MSNAAPDVAESPGYPHLSSLLDAQRDVSDLPERLSPCLDFGEAVVHEIVDALKAVGVTLATDQIRLEGPLRELGLYTVKVHFHSEVQGEVKVWVVPTANTDAT